MIASPLLAGLGKYRKAAQLGVQENMEYRVNFLLEGCVSLISLLIQYYLWKSIYGGPGAGVALQGYTLAQMLTYTIVAQTWGRIAGGDEVGEAFASDVRQGGLNKYLIRPVSDLGYRLSTYLGHKATFALLRLVPAVAVMVLFHQLFALHAHPRLIYLPVAMALALVLQFAFTYAFSMVAFWWQDIWGLLFLKSILGNFLAGGWFPLDLVPPQIMRWLDILPFKYLVFFPTQIVLDRIPASEIAKGLAIQLAWIAILFVIQRMLWNKGLRGYTAAGG